MKLNKVLTAFVISSSCCASLYAQTVTGVVKNSSGQAIVNAQVSVVKSKQSVFTDENGQFVLHDLQEGHIEIHVTKATYSHKNQKLAIGQQDVSGIELVLAPASIEVIDVHATPLHSSNIESALPVNVIASDELRLKQASTLGETLKNEVGVHSTYYGPVASSPIIRGLDGPRVLITQNGLDVGDASRVGPDHVVSSETATAQQIEVLRGPATLFYGSGAIGGVVNVVDNRVPNALDRSFDYMIKHNDVADENEASFALNSFSEQLAWHLDGFWRNSNDYQIPGFAESDELHASDEEDGHESADDEDEHQETGVLANSASKSSGFTLGSSYVLDNGFIGFSFGQMNRNYGIPGHGAGHEHHDDEEEGAITVAGDMEQERIQLLSELNFDQGMIHQVSSKIAYTDYQHQEIENGEVGTEFNSQMMEMRFDIFHQEYLGFKGAWTLHFKTADFEAVGEEAFTPPSTTKSLAFAWLEEKHFDNVLLQLGARIEHVELEASISESDDEHDHHADDEQEHSALSTQSFTPISVSAGAVWDYSAGYNLGFSTSYSQRAPSAGELYANGPHIGTNTYEVGALYQIEHHEDETHFDLTDNGAELETALNFDITWRKFEDKFGFVISGFYNHIDDYYYQQSTGLLADAHHDEHSADGHDDGHGDGLPVYRYQQSDVIMYGVEAEFIYQWDNGIRTTIFSDYIRAKLADEGNLPRIPPMRIGAQIEYQAERYAMQMSLSHYFDQNKVAELESSTQGYTMLDANANYYLDGIGDDLVLFVKLNNITNEEARVHASFLKNVSPLPARGFELGIRGSF